MVLRLPSLVSPLVDDGPVLWVAVSPKRIVRKRTRGWKMPEGAVYVGRPTKWGNPFRIDGDWITWTAIAIGFRADEAGRRKAAVALHQAWITGTALRLREFDPIAAKEVAGGYLEFSDGAVVSMADHAAGLAVLGAAVSEDPPELPERPTDFSELRGKDLACWCPVGLACHADVLLELANA